MELKVWNACQLNRTYDRKTIIMQVRVKTIIMQVLVKTIIMQVRVFPSISLLNTLLFDMFVCLPLVYCDIGWVYICCYSVLLFLLNGYQAAITMSTWPNKAVPIAHSHTRMPFSTIRTMPHLSQGPIQQTHLSQYRHNIISDELSVSSIDKEYMYIYKSDPSIYCSDALTISGSKNGSMIPLDW